jgi:hypothetical protein
MTTTLLAIAIAVAAILAGCASPQRFSPPPQYYYQQQTPAPQPQYERPTRAPVPGAPFTRDREDQDDVPQPRARTRVNPEYRQEQEAAPIVWNRCPAP